VISVDKKPVIVLTGGGTAGHVMPNVALLSYIESFDVHYIGSMAGIERDIVKGFPWVTYHGITTEKLRRGLSLSNLVMPFRVLRGIREARAVLKTIGACAVFSKGGFVAYPVVRAAASLGIRVIVHESDMTMGLANRMSAKYADVICTTFAKTTEAVRKKYKKVLHTGAPIRQSIYKGSKEKVQFGFSNKKNLLIMGGSLGAKRINEAVWDSLDKFIEWNILHIVGKGKLNEVVQRKNYVQVEFINDIENALAWADVVVSRAGSNSLCELMVLGKPSVFIPLSTGRGDQLENAKEVERLGVGIVLLEENLDTKSLVQSVDEAYSRRNELGANTKKMGNLDGTKKIVKLIID
jgi:UDP-N-acetylglucosamine--N-acetylmuramyl-(pentapeptide) pyrophosphoryl-undecaprenol N-acetylglucosamine transferase